MSVNRAWIITRIAKIVKNIPTSIITATLTILTGVSVTIAFTRTMRGAMNVKKFSLQTICPLAVIVVRMFVQIV